MIITNVAGNPQSQYIAKELVLSSPRQMGSTSVVGRFKIPADQGSNFSIGRATEGGRTFSLQYTISTIYEVRNGKARAIPAPLSQRSFVINYQ
ncbi:MAG: hypothetical protein U0176_09680 [Bacteroidia bacterium]